MTTTETLLLVMAVVVLAMGIVVAVMMWQSSRRRHLLRRRKMIIEREQQAVNRLSEEARREGIVQGAWAWDGDGTSAKPYLIKSSADWKQLADDVSGGNSYSGKFFALGICIRPSTAIATL